MTPANLIDSGAFAAAIQGELTQRVGDVAFAKGQPVAGKITPNPGGVGPMAIAMLMQNTARATEMTVR